MLHIMKYATVGKTAVDFRLDGMRRFLALNALGKPAARPRYYRSRGTRRHAGKRECERHLRQMAAGQLDFSASDPAIWRNRQLTPVFVTDTRCLREFGRQIRRRYRRDLKRRADSHVD